MKKKKKKKKKKKLIGKVDFHNRAHYFSEKLREQVYLDLPVFTGNCLRSR